MMHFDESFYLAIAFVVFCLIAYKPVKNGILDLLNKKRVEITNKVLDAESLRARAKELLAKARQDLEHIEADNERSLEQSRREIAKILDEKTNNLEQDLERKYQSTLAHLNLKKEVSVLNLYGEFVSIAQKIALSYIQDNQSNLPDDLKIAQKLLDVK